MKINIGDLESVLLDHCEQNGIFYREDRSLVSRAIYDVLSALAETGEYTSPRMRLELKCGVPVIVKLLCEETTNPTFLVRKRLIASVGGYK